MLTPNFENLYEDVQAALKRWHGREKGQNPLEKLVLFRQIQGERQVGAEQAHVVLLTEAINCLAERDAESATFLRQRFIYEESVRQLAQRFHVAESTVYVMQRQAIERLCVEIQQLEREALATYEFEQIQRLEPATYEELIGVDDQICQLIQLLVTSGPSRIISLEGIGGIGKTSLADALLRRIIAQGLFPQVGWISARQSQLTLDGSLLLMDEPALSAEDLVERLAKQLLADVGTTEQVDFEQRLRLLRHRLKEIPHLIVVDNLETLYDVESLLPTLHDLADPTKFVLTSRERVYGVMSVFHFELFCSVYRSDRAAAPYSVDCATVWIRWTGRGNNSASACESCPVIITTSCDCALVKNLRIQGSFVSTPM